MDQDNRVVVLVDMDCFYCQVEEKLNPELAGKPIAVVQYNPWKGGGIIAVNYVARALGVTRHMRGDEAKEKCPEIQLPSVPCQRGKADITKYRDAGKEVVKVLQKYTSLLERASIDEAYLDITEPVQERLKTLNVNSVTSEMMPNTFALGYECLDGFMSEVVTCGSDSIEFDYDHAKRLLVGAVIVSEMRAAVYTETGYKCSAGIAHNKILAKLVCGMNKPNKQTILPKHALNILYKTLPLKKVKHLGGKFGDNVLQILRITTMAELQQFPEKELQTKFDEKNGTWLYNMARGINLEAVQARLTPKSIGCCKQLRGKSALTNLDSLRKWLRDLGDEIEDRLEQDALENNRTPKQMVVSYSTQLPNGQDSSSSRSYNFVPDEELCGDLFSKKALELLMESAEGVKIKDGEENRKLKAPIKFLGISVGKFEDNTENKKVKKIKDYFSAGSSKQTVSKAKQITHENKSPDNIKTNHGKKNILQKFLQITSESQKDKNDVKVNDTNNVPIETTLETHESVFAQQENKQHVSDKGNNGKDFVLQKFFQSTTEPSEAKRDVTNNKRPIETTLDKQESFFAKFLTGNVTSIVQPLNTTDTLKTCLPEDRSTTPVCNVVQCGEDSNDTDYSGSTINMEINKSIALFDDDADVVDRVSKIRQLLHSSKITETDDNSDTANDNEETQVKSEQKDLPSSSEANKVFPEIIQTVECPECKKIISIENLDIHSDYHLALKLRSEERELYRKERDKRKEVEEKSNRSEIVIHKQQPKKSEIEVSPSEKLPSIANFFVKIDDTRPTEICTECGKKVAVEKLPEHLDFHEAQKLSRTLNNKTNPVCVTGSKAKRKRKSTSPVKKPKYPCKSIDVFFRP